MTNTQPTSRQLSDLTALLDAQRRSSVVRELTSLQARMDGGAVATATTSVIVDVRGAGAQSVVNPDPCDVLSAAGWWTSGLDLVVEHLADDDSAKTSSDWPQVRLTGQPRQLALALARAGLADEDEDAWLS